METEAWRHLVSRVASLARTATGARQTLTAWLGDALAYSGARGRGLITECAEAAGFDAGTLRNAKMVCARIPVSCRHDALSWTHHCEVGLAFADPSEIERWLAIAEKERLSTSALRVRVRAHVATLRGNPRTEADGASIAAFRLMRELRAVGRSLVRERHQWQQWSPTAAQLALQELRPLTDFIDAVRNRALRRSTKPSRDLEAN
ncbi:MAG: hypothetical protein HZA93_25600 [Verrucomicrobia bacterium]|nr:hypothetical protein [Verrucomicrobiota bacterium]